MLARSETDGEIGVAEQGTDPLALTALVFDDRAGCRTAISPTLIVVIGDALALPRARQVFGSAATDRTLGRLGGVGVGNLPVCAGLHSGHLSIVVAVVSNRLYF
jgi:hypothetical protein